MICGPEGVSKSTLAQRLAIARCGIHDAPTIVLGHQVQPMPEGGRLAYLAMDRPRQIARSMKRMLIKPAQWRRFDERVSVWRGPLPFDLVNEPTSTLADWLDGLPRCDGRVR
ncbi:MAG: hypothetical protein U5K30_14070 [Acidimicrobiales bacterium]|nr:hypothetical protein [Acidimicrobiales bacterium]